MKNNIIIITAESNGEKQTKTIYVPLSYFLFRSRILVFE